MNNEVPVSKISSLDSADHFNIVTLWVDSGLFHCIAIHDCGYADCQKNEGSDNAEKNSKNSQRFLAEAHEV